MNEHAKPTIPIQNIYYMLAYAFQALHETGFQKVAGEAFEHIHDFFAAILSLGVAKQIKQGLYRDYIPKKEALSCLRGKICIAKSIKLQMLRRKQLVCAYEEYFEDSPHNQALKSVMLLLLRKGVVKEKRKTSLRRCLLYFSYVTDISPYLIRWDVFKYHRNNATYRMLIGVCELVIKGLLQTQKEGKYTLRAWLNNEKMHKLFEKFVLCYYQKHFPEYKPKLETIEWKVENNSDSRFLPRMETDIALEYDNKCLIVDTKYYAKTMQGRVYASEAGQAFAKKTYISSHLYQIYAYVKNKEASCKHSVSGMLLYAKTDEEETPNACFSMGQNRIILKTLDMNQEWEEIRKQLKCFVDDYFKP